MKLRIIESKFYWDIVQFIAINGEVRSYEITEKFNPPKKRGKFVNDNDIKKNKCNFSMKLQNLCTNDEKIKKWIKTKKVKDFPKRKSIGVIKRKKGGSRGRHGKYSKYEIYWDGIQSEVVDRMPQPFRSSFIYTSTDYRYDDLLKSMIKEIFLTIMKYEYNDLITYEKKLDSLQLYTRDYLDFFHGKLTNPPYMKKMNVDTHVGNRISQWEGVRCSLDNTLKYIAEVIEFIYMTQALTVRKN